MYRKPYRIRKKKSILKSRFFRRLILFLILAGEIFYLLYFFSFFQIDEIKISGEKKTSKTDISSVVEKEIEKKILFFRTKSIFLVNLNKIKERIFEDFPPIGEVEVKRKLPNVLSLAVKEREGAGVFCLPAGQAGQNDKCFLLDRNGIIFEQASEDNQLIKIMAENSSLPNLKIGEGAVEKVMVSQILEIEEKLKQDIKIPLDEVLIVSDDRLNVKTIEGWEIYFNPQEDLNWQLTKLKAVLDNEISPEKRKNLEYIELRFGNLAPYKYR